jgi:hypothetical protein
MYIYPIDEQYHSSLQRMLVSNAIYHPNTGRPSIYPSHSAQIGLSSLTIASPNPNMPSKYVESIDELYRILLEYGASANIHFDSDRFKIFYEYDPKENKLRVAESQIFSSAGRAMLSLWCNLNFISTGHINSKNIAELIQMADKLVPRMTQVASSLISPLTLIFRLQNLGDWFASLSAHSLSYDELLDNYPNFLKEYIDYLKKGVIASEELVNYADKYLSELYSAKDNRVGFFLSSGHRASTKSIARNLISTINPESSQHVDIVEYDNVEYNLKKFGYLYKKLLYGMSDYTVNEHKFACPQLTLTVADIPAHLRLLLLLGALFDHNEDSTHSILNPTAICDLSKTKQPISVHMPILCLQEEHVCSLCYGTNLMNHQLVAQNSDVGLWAAQAIGESITQINIDKIKHLVGSELTNYLYDYINNNDKTRWDFISPTPAYVDLNGTLYPTANQHIFKPISNLQALAGQQIRPWVAYPVKMTNQDLVVCGTQWSRWIVALNIWMRCVENGASLNFKHAQIAARLLCGEEGIIKIDKIIKMRRDPLYIASITSTLKYILHATIVNKSYPLNSRTRLILNPTTK